MAVSCDDEAVEKEDALRGGDDSKDSLLLRKMTGGEKKEFSSQSCFIGLLSVEELTGVRVDGASRPSGIT